MGAHDRIALDGGALHDAPVPCSQIRPGLAPVVGGAQLHGIHQLRAVVQLHRNFLRPLALVALVLPDLDDPQADRLLLNDLRLGLQRHRRIPHRYQRGFRQIALRPGAQLRAHHQVQAPRKLAEAQRTLGVGAALRIRDSIQRIARQRLRQRAPLLRGIGLQLHRAVGKGAHGDIRPLRVDLRHAVQRKRRACDGLTLACVADLNRTGRRCQSRARQHQQQADQRRRHPSEDPFLSVRFPRKCAHSVHLAPNSTRKPAMPDPAVTFLFSAAASAAPPAAAPAAPAQPGTPPPHSGSDTPRPNPRAPAPAPPPSRCGAPAPAADGS